MKNYELKRELGDKLWPKKKKRYFILPFSIEKGKGQEKLRS